MFYEDRKSHRAARAVLKGLGIRLPVSPLAHRGVAYRTFLAALHRAKAAENYLEIGVRTGQSLKLAHGFAVGVDPGADPTITLSDRRQMFKLTSDDFFAKEAARVFPRGIDLAFIDGMHQIEFVVRDFMNTERFATPGALIVLHDAMPINTPMTTRDEQDPNRPDHLTRLWWPGDVWKILPILKTYRPDLTITCLDCPPTGLVLVSNLDPKSTALATHYDEIVTRYVPMSLDAYGFDTFRREFPGASSKAFMKDLSASLKSIGVSSGA